MVCCSGGYQIATNELGLKVELEWRKWLPWPQYCWLGQTSKDWRFGFLTAAVVAGTAGAAIDKPPVSATLVGGVFHTAVFVAVVFVAALHSFPVGAAFVAAAIFVAV